MKIGGYADRWLEDVRMVAKNQDLSVWHVCLEFPEFQEFFGIVS